NVVQRPDGSLDADVEQMLAELADWNAVNGEAIFGTRPWLVYGEGGTKAKGGHFQEDYKYSAKDIRFTKKGDVLYAIALGQPSDGQLTVRSLGKPAEGGNQLSSVTLLGYEGKLEWKQTADGLLVKLPAELPSKYTVALKITGTDLKPVALAQVFEPVRPDAHCTLTLDAESAQLHGEQIKLEQKGDKTNIGFWDRADEWVSWNVAFEWPGAYTVSATVSAIGGGEFVVEASGQQISGKAPKTGDWAEFRTSQVGRLHIEHAGQQEVKVRAHDAGAWRAINLQCLTLHPQPEP
ncbi:MAG: alpha-L-fucosidase C-terminal domain-containing protein, partial [Bryobacteraceae bacterium]